MDYEDEVERIIESADLKADVIQNLKVSKRFNFLNAGNHRVITKPVDRSVVYKIEMRPNQNKTEFNLYNTKKDLQSRLLPITNKEETYRWIKCPTASFGVPDQRKKEFLDSLVENYGQIPSDFSSDDIGVVDDRIVIVDYGYGFQDHNTKIDQISDIES